MEEITRRVEAEQALLRRVDVLDELTRIGQAVGTADELAERSARLVGEALGASGTAYGLFTADGSGYETTRAIGVSQPIADWLAAATPAESIGLPPLASRRGKHPRAVRAGDRHRRDPRDRRAPPG